MAHLWDARRICEVRNNILNIVFLGKSQGVSLSLIHISVTVIIAMILYLLLPVVRNTNTGLNHVNPLLKETADAMGMSGRQKLMKVEFPLAFPFILTGIRITVVNAVGVAVFGTFVGGGGLGSILYRGIRIQNLNLILEGTLALIVISMCFDYLLGFFEKKIRRFL